MAKVKCRKCGKAYDPYADGYDGMCPRCADKDEQENAGTNTNVLEGMRCPISKCKSEGPFRIEARAIFTVRDDGTDAEYSDVEWKDNYFCGCVECGYVAQVKDFRIRNQKKRKWR